MYWLINTPFLKKRSGFFVSDEEGFYTDPHKMPQ